MARRFSLNNEIKLPEYKHKEFTLSPTKEFTIETLNNTPRKHCGWS